MHLKIYATKRVGKDLHIAFEGTDINHPDVIIDGYYAHTDELVVGKAETGLYYDYVPESAADVDAISALDSGDVAGQALGGDGVVSPLWIPGNDFGFSALGVTCRSCRSWCHRCRSRRWRMILRQHLLYQKILYQQLQAR